MGRVPSALAACAILITELDRDGHAEFAAKARALLTTFRTSLQLMRNDLSRIEKESRRTGVPEWRPDPLR
jgi:hypothetical protein